MKPNDGLSRRESADGGAARILGMVHTGPAFDVPAGACDCHVHVFAAAGRFPFAPDRMYTPGPATVDDLLALQRALHLDRVVVVAASPYGNDNSSLLDALRGLGGRARGVAIVEPTTSDDDFRTMHELGVRGARINLETYGRTDPSAVADKLAWLASRVAPLGWHVQIFTHLSVITALHDTLKSLPTPVVVDHFGLVQAALGVRQEGFEAMLELVRSGRMYVKLSAAHRIADDPGYASAGIIARALIAANEDRMLWGSNWPHPVSPHRIDEISPYRAQDDGHSLNQLKQWTTGTTQLHKILVDNPAHLYGF